MKKKLTIVYDVTPYCVFNCNICCMGASNDPACRGTELTPEQKLRVTEQVKELEDNGYDVRVDLSGGEIFTNVPVHKQLIAAFSAALGKEKVGISCSGYNVDSELAEFLAKNVHDVELTMDVAPDRAYKLRPRKYGEVAAKAVGFLKEAGCKVGIQTVVSSYNNKSVDALGVLAWTCANGVDNWSILRFFPSGRGARFPEAAMTDAECEDYVKRVQSMVNYIQVEHKPEVDFHYLMPGHSKYTTECRCVRKSIGILPNGDVVACFWALDSATGAIDPKFLLGNVKESSLLEILNSEKARYWSDCSHGCELSVDEDKDGGNSYDVLSA